MSTLQTLKNIGPTLSSKLLSTSIQSPAELRQLGSKEAFKRMKAKYPNCCLVHLYTLEAAILDIEISSLQEEIKEDLKQFYHTNY